MTIAHHGFAVMVGYLPPGGLGAWQSDAVVVPGPWLSRGEPQQHQAAPVNEADPQIRA